MQQRADSLDEQGLDKRCRRCVILTCNLLGTLRS